MVVSGGSVSGGAPPATMKVRVAGVGSELPAGSLAVTENVCGPPASAPVVYGETHDGAAESTWQLNVEPCSLDLN